MHKINKLGSISDKSCRHEGPVWEVCWAHPKFGVILASCGYDRKVIIWKEVSPDTWDKLYVYNGHELSGMEVWINGLS